MFKFFRKYQKVIILAGLPILLVIFLVPQAIQGIGNYVAQRGRAIGSYVDPLTGDSHTIKVVEFTQGQRELAVITRGLQGNNLGAMLGIAEINQVSHWLLLVREAENLGLIGGRDDAEYMASIIARQISQGAEQPFTAMDVMGILYRGSSMSSAQPVYDTLTRLRGVMRMVQLYRGATKLSDRRLQIKAEDILQKIDARVVVISADGEIDEDSEEQPLPEPTEEQRLAQMQQFAEDNPGEGERGFGYRLPDRVKIEWIEISPDKVRDRLSTSDKLSDLELQKHWRRNKDLFLPLGVTDPGDVQFAQVEDRVREALLRDLMQTTIVDIVRYAEGEVARRTRELTREGAYFALPDDWAERQVDLNDLTKTIGEEFNAGYPAYSIRDSEWLSGQDLNLLPGIGFARNMDSGTPARLVDLINTIKEFGGDPSNRLFAQAHVVGPTLRAGGAAYLWRVTAVEESRPPITLEEAGEAVRDDLLKIAEYDRLEQRMAELERQAETEGLDSVAEMYGTRPIPQNDIGYSPDGSVLLQYRLNATSLLPPVGRHEEAINQIVERAKAIIETMLANGQPFDDVSINDRTFMIAVPDKLAVVLVQLTDLQPLTQERLPEITGPVFSLLSADELGDDPINFFDEEQMLKRYQYEGTSAADDDDDDGDEAADTDADAEDAAATDAEEN